ncbi:hypothetical protein GQ42DRAFT_159346 [Ramicandelaber brevisporus]|nr:hypothetical protein GQ42DRAFT_159346 [Ramicandelaber brevisporus]
METTTATATTSPQASSLAPWSRPEPAACPPLRLLNSLTRSKDEFIPTAPGHVTWYCCGPTVYNSSHAGHARNYLSNDIIRRVLSDFFGYNVRMVLNITDIDDKIIIAARKEHVLKELSANFAELKSAVAVVDEALTRFIREELKVPDVTASAWGSVRESLMASTGNEDHQENAKSASLAYDALATAQHSPASMTPAELFAAASDVLDHQYGASVADPAIFRKYAAYWESEYFRDMDALGILRPSVVTRVTDFVPQIIHWVEQLIARGYAYVADDSSVYFDTARFSNTEGKFYAKLQPNSKSDSALIVEGEGRLGARLTGQRNKSDFVGGSGRPGWHIECSVMASEVLGPQIDIHTGGIDLRFPHHDNELALSEAFHHDCDQWVNYFLHIGHLNTKGRKMSKSLKNFETIQAILERWTAQQLRISMLMQPWHKPMEFSDGDAALGAAIAIEKSLRNFFADVHSLQHEQQQRRYETDRPLPYGDVEKQLASNLEAATVSVYGHLADSINTVEAMRVLLQLAKLTSEYIVGASSAATGAVNTPLVESIARYITRVLSAFGLNFVWSDRTGLASDASSAAGTNDGLDASVVAMPYLRILADFRANVRALARNNSSSGSDSSELAAKLLILTDALRDDILPEMNVHLDDRDTGSTLIKFMPKAQIMAIKEQKLQEDKERMAQKTAAAAEKKLKQQEALEKGKTSPSVMFYAACNGGLTEYDGQFEQFDEKGLPTHDSNGIELAKSHRKRLSKLQKHQEQLHAKYLATSKTESSFPIVSESASAALKKPI